MTPDPLAEAVRIVAAAACAERGHGETYDVRTWAGHVLATVCLRCGARVKEDNDDADL